MGETIKKCKDLIDLRKIHVITQKELVEPDQLTGCTAVVIDVFLATSTIAFLLKNNYKSIYAMNNMKSARDFAADQVDPYILLGESKGKAVEGFLYPDPSLIQPAIHNQSAIISSTNGTKAIDKAKIAKKMYLSSIVNGHVISERLNEEDDSASIVVICSGSDNRFSLEDFVGAGQLIDNLLKKGKYHLSDVAKVAREAFFHSQSVSFDNLYESQTGMLLHTLGYEESMNLIIQSYEQLNVIPVFKDNRIVNDDVSISQQ